MFNFVEFSCLNNLFQAHTHFFCRRYFYFDLIFFSNSINFKPLSDKTGEVFIQKKVKIILTKMKRVEHRDVVSYLFINLFYFNICNFLQ